MSTGVSRSSAIDANRRSNLDQLQAGQRHARELQARHRAEPRELHVLEAIENVLRSEMDFRRKHEQSVGTAMERVGGVPGHLRCVGRAGLSDGHFSRGRISGLDLARRR
jgi:hypothetical protein